MEMFFAVINIIIGLLVILFIALIVFILLKTRNFRPKIHLKQNKKAFDTIRVSSGSEYEKIRGYRHMAEEKLQKLAELVQKGSEKELHLALIKADSLMDEILKEHGCEGMDMGERLKTLHPDEISNLNDLWEAHKIRNRLAHEPDFHIPAQEAKKLIDVYYKAMEDIMSKELELCD